MLLRELICVLETADQEKVVPLGFSNPHSYRGYYDQLAFEPAPNVTIGEMLRCAKESVGKVFHGWKGGEYTMDEYTTVWLANHGCTGEGIGPVLLAYMLGIAQ